MAGDSKTPGGGILPWMSQQIHPYLTFNLLQENFLYQSRCEISYLEKLR